METLINHHENQSEAEISSGEYEDDSLKLLQDYMAQYPRGLSSSK
jgi:hypothetical protein